MVLFPILSVTFLTGCATPDVVIRMPEVTPELRRICEGPELSAETLRDLAAILVDYDQALTCANGRIIAIDEILTEFEAEFGG
jgi:hypothetical protein